MYLVELRPGKEELFRTGDELAAAIRRGDVDVHSRIYHRATSKWISITLHPQYKAIVSQMTTQPAPLDRSNWTYLNAQSETLEGSQPDPVDPSDPEAEGVAQRGSQPWRRLFALSVAGLSLLFGVQLAFSGPRPPWAASKAARSPVIPAAAQQKEESAADEQVISLASTSTAWSEDAGLENDEPEPAPKAAASAAPALPRAPALKLKTLDEVLPAEKEKESTEAGAETVEALIGRYGTAHEAARARLASGMRVARLGNLLAASRLTPDGGVTETRMGLAGVANFIRVYRQQEEVIEQEYQDSFAVMSKEHRWTTKALRLWHGRSAPKESPALTALSADLLAAVDSVLGLLTEQAGAYRLGEGTIAFEDPGASRRYGRLRRQVTKVVDAARVAGGEESQGPMRHLLEAIGTSRLPREI